MLNIVALTVVLVTKFIEGFAALFKVKLLAAVTVELNVAAPVEAIVNLVVPSTLNNKLELWIDVSYTNIINTTSYESLLQSITSSQYIKDNINGSSLTKTDDITEYKMVMICLNILNDIKLDYDKFHNTFNDYFSDVSGLNLLEYHQSIVEIIRSIEFITPTLFEVCIPYFNSGETDYDLSTITINGDNYYNLLKTKYTNVDNYDRIINNYTNSFNDLLRPNI